MILLVEHLVIFDLPVTSRVLLQEVGKSVLALNIDFNFTISVLSGELEPLGDDGLHLGDRAVSFGLDCSTDSLMHDPVTVLETLFRNFDEFVNSAAARPGGKDVSIVVKQGSVSRPFLGISMGRPALTYFSNSESIKLLLNGTVHKSGALRQRWTVSPSSRHVGKDVCAVLIGRMELLMVGVVRQIVPGAYDSFLVVEKKEERKIEYIPPSLYMQSKAFQLQRVIIIMKHE